MSESLAPMQARHAAPTPRVPLLPGRMPGPLPIRMLGRVVDWAVIGMGAVMVVLVFSNVLLHVVDRDMAWTTELGEFLMVWVSFFGGAAATQRGGHMAITEFVNKLSPRARLRADFVLQAFSLVVVGSLMFYGWRLVQGNWGNELTVLEWPMAYQYMGMALGSTAMAVFLGFDLVQIARGVPRDERYPAES
ncbi:TRAP transporter small permease [Ramlibacter ginsenosidimutans]|uniref:TRAP transporter small permease protein n=1 Tax=Ramlibacter ginsenosidimutans TaxID=502333 RepID=A0A934WKP5_9BURK|nr:TRAP transporter small permease [Ramlibacter ginsenosidimutans]MBK6004820.1 TRAP transporter small permease [Ramlibacter ginsenosidimutans]